MNKGLVFLNEVINAIYRRTAAKEGEGGLLRRWMVDEWVWQFDAEGVGALKWVESKILAREFLFGVVRAQAGRLGDGAKVSGSFLRYGVLKCANEWCWVA